MRRFTIIFTILFIAAGPKTLFGGAAVPDKKIITREDIPGKDELQNKISGGKNVSESPLEGAKAMVPAMGPNASRFTAYGSLSYLAESIADDNDVIKAYKSYMLAYLEKETQLCTEYGAYMENYIKNEKGELEERRFAIGMTNKMEIVIFVVVHILLVIAILITITEFYNAQQTRGKKSEIEEIELSFQKIALKTSMHGTVLLVLTLFLYLLFLKFVYPVTVV